MVLFYIFVYIISYSLQITGDIFSLGLRRAHTHNIIWVNPSTVNIFSTQIVPFLLFEIHTQTLKKKKTGLFEEMADSRLLSVSENTQDDFGTS